MASIQTNTNHTYYAILNITEIERTADAITNNYTDLNYSVTLYNGIQNFSGYTIGYDVYINDEQVAYQTNSGNQTSMPANSSKLVVSGTKRVYHDSDGTKNNVQASVRIFTNNASYLPVELNGLGTFNISSIPRYANFIEHYVKETGLNYIKIHWNADTYCDAVQYSVNNSGWVDSVGLDYTISDLKPGTSYNIKSRIRRADSGLWTESEYVYATTQDIARITNIANLNHGDNANIMITNPSGSALSLSIKIGSTQILTRTVSTGTNVVVFSDTELDNIYKLYGSSNSVTATFILTTANVYIDTKNSIVTLTGNQKTIRAEFNGVKRGKLFYKYQGEIKRAVVWIGDSNKISRRCM